MYGKPANATEWPPACTSDGADMFQYAPPPDPGIPCCDGLVACIEPRPDDYPGKDMDSVVVCRSGKCDNPAPSRLVAAARAARQ